MPKRLSDAELDAALAAGEPPRSQEYIDDDVWHEKQNEWLERWQPGRALPPPPEEKHRRTEWDKLTKQHARAFKVADATASTVSSAEEAWRSQHHICSNHSSKRGLMNQRRSRHYNL